MTNARLKPFILNSFLIIVLTVVSATAFNYMRPTPLSWVWAPPPPMAQVIDKMDIFKEKLSDSKTILVDARPELFYRLSHIPGAISFPEGITESKDLAIWEKSIPQDAVIIIYCSDSKCRMADDLATKMSAIGLTSSIFLPGFAAWEKAGMSLESGLSPSQASPPEVL